MARTQTTTTKTATKKGIFAKKMTEKTKTKDGFVRAGGRFQNYTQLALIGNPNETFEMYYLTTRLVESEKFDSGSANLHLFLMKDSGEIVQVWGAGQLDHLLNDVSENAPGALCRIRWVDKVKVQLKGSKKKIAVNQFELEYNPDDTVDPTDYITAKKSH